MMPPDSMKPRELWLELSTTPRPHRVRPFPRKGADGKPVFSIALVPLTQDEHLRAAIDAEKLVRQELPDAKQDESTGYDVAYSNAVAVFQLFVSCRDENNIEKRIFPSAGDLRRSLTTDEVGALYSLYLDVAAEVGPLISRMSKSDAEAWIDRLVEGGEAHDPLGLLGPAALQTLLRCSISRLRTLRTATSSAGSQPESIGNDSPSPSHGSGLESSDSEGDAIGKVT